MASETNKKSKSPYQRYGKKPFVYSEPYRRWRDLAVRLGAQDHRTIEAARDHTAYLARLHGGRWPVKAEAR